MGKLLTIYDGVSKLIKLKTTKEYLKIIKGVSSKAINNGLLKIFLSICNFNNPERNKRIISKYPLSM